MIVIPVRSFDSHGFSRFLLSVRQVGPLYVPLHLRHSRYGELMLIGRFGVAGDLAWGGVAARGDLVRESSPRAARYFYRGRIL